MIKGFPIDYLRQIFEQTLLREHLKNNNYFGGKDQVFIASLYEQLVEGDDVDRFVDNISDISNQQNRTSTILNGVITAPSNPTITNLYSCTIVPMEYVCSLRCREVDNPQALETLNNLIEELKGSKVDVAELKCVSEEFGTSYVPFVVGTIGHNDGAPYIKSGDYLGHITSANDVDTLLNALYTNQDLSINIQQTDTWLYCERSNKLVVVYGVYNGLSHTFTWSVLEDDGSHPEIIFPPEHVSFEKYKVSISCEAMRCDPPFDLNGDKYNFLSFGGSATLQNASVMFGNDLVKVAIQKNKIIVSDNANQNIVFGGSATKYWVEPLEMPSGNNPSTKLIQLASNNFKTNSHTDGITPTLQYSFVVDKSIPLIKQWFDYARYGDINVNQSESLAMSPNLIYNVYEVWSSWGEVEIKSKLAKISDSSDIDITEGDTMTIGIVLQIQGENN